jgi:hypothetical protein
MGCATMNMNLEPDRYITILDSKTMKPVPNLPLIYCDIQKPYFIVGKVLMSRPYTTDKNGRAQVPSDVHLQVGPGSDYMLDRSRDIGKTDREILNNEIYYVTKWKQEIEQDAPRND